MSNFVNLGSWVNRLENNSQLEMATATKLRELADPFVPFLTGNLARNVEITKDGAGAHIVYNEPYAHYQFVHTEFKHTTTFHPQAGGQWVEMAMQAHPGELENYVEKRIVDG